MPTSPTPGRRAPMRTGRLRVHAVVDSTGATRTLRPETFTDLAQGRLGVRARPGMRRASWLASDLLMALGCRDDVAGAGRAGEGSLDLVAAWLLTHRIEHLYVQYAWTLRADVLDALLATAATAGCHLWLVGDTGYAQRYVDQLAGYQPITISGEEFVAIWADLAGAEPAADRQVVAHTWPQQLPADDFTTFRAACRDLLTPTQFQAVDDHFRAQVDLLQPAVHVLAGTAATREERVADWFAAQWQDSPTLQHFQVTVRAAQVAFFRAGYYLQVDLDQLIGTATTSPRRALRTPELWDRLHAYPEPHRAAVCALAAAGLAVSQIRSLPVAAYSPTSGTVTLTDGTEATIEEPARLYLEAQQHLRRNAGATDDDLLFANARGHALAERALVTVINDARRELGVAVAPATPDRKPTTGDRWFTRWGISLQELS